MSVTKPATNRWTANARSPLASAIHPFLKKQTFPPTPESLKQLTTFPASHPLFKYSGSSKTSFTSLYSNATSLYTGIKVYRDTTTTFTGDGERTLMVFQNMQVSS